MKALRIDKHGGPEVMHVVDVPLPEPGQGELRVKVEVCGLNYSDIMIREGRYVDRMPMPYLMGREFCGTIDKLGPGVQTWITGQRVVGTAAGGAMAEYAVANAAGLYPCPDRLTPPQAVAILIQGITAMHSVDDCAGLKSGETMLVHAAAGGVGTLAIQIGLAKNAKVIGTASSDEKCKLIRDLGATAVNYMQGDWVKEVRALTGGKGADVILESVGGDVFIRSFKEALADFGRMVVYGVAGGQVVTLDNREILVSNKTVIGYYLGSYFPKYVGRVLAASQKLAALIMAGKLKPIIGQTFPLDKAIDAFNHMQNRQSIGKVVIVP